MKKKPKEKEPKEEDPKKRQERRRLFAYAGLLFLSLFGIKGATIGMHYLTQWIVTHNEQQMEERAPDFSQETEEPEEESESGSSTERKETERENEPESALETEKPEKGSEPTSAPEPESRKNLRPSTRTGSAFPARNPQTPKKGGNE